MNRNFNLSKGWWVKSLLLPALFFPIAACSVSADDVIASDTAAPKLADQDIDTADTTAQIPDSNAVENQPEPLDTSVTETTARTDAYSAALKTLESEAVANPAASPALNSLIDYPEQVYEIFDGCLTDETYSAENPETAQRLSDMYLGDLADHVQTLTVNPLSDGKAYITMRCQLGPYWVSVGNYIYDYADSTAPEVQYLTYPTYQVETGEVVSTDSHIATGLQQFDAETSEITLFRKYRGVGDCGYEATYLLEDDALTLTQFNEKAECDGTIPEEGFPQLYP